MRRHNQLRVNTFPFLAVLLCAMGSLILILLVMDRRSRMAALQQGQDEAGRAVQERAEAIAARERENSLEQGEFKIAYDRKKAELKARLDAEQRALDAEARQVQARLAEIATELRGEEEVASKLRSNVRTEQGRLTRHDQALAAARKAAADLEGKLTAADRARHKLAADMIQFEQIVRDLHEARKRDAMTYSVVPYKGKRGEKRRPLYVECSASGLVFHPDKLTLTDPAIPVVQEEIARRAFQLAEHRKQAGLKEERAYLLMLVRPDGIKRYYQVQSAIHDLPVEFGYEFVDADWELTIPEGGEVAEAATAPAATPTASAWLEGRQPGLEGSGRTDGQPVPRLATGVGIGPPGGSLDGDPATGGDASVQLSRPQPSSEGPDLGIGKPTGDTLPPIGATNPGDPPLVRPLLALPGSVAAGQRNAIAAASQGPDLGPAKPRTFPLLPVPRGGPDDTIIYIECLSDGVVVHPSGKSFSIDSLNHSPTHNPLYQAVAALLAKHTGDPNRRAIRYLTRPDAEKTFHLASPAFNNLGVSQRRIILQPGDDISQFVAGE